MKCRRARKLIYDFIDGVIGDPDRIVLETHLGDCPSCEEMATGLAKSMDMLHKLPKVQPNDNFNWKVRLAIQQAKHSSAADVAYSRGWMRSWNLRFAYSALSTFIIVAATGYLLTRPDVFPRTDSGLLATNTRATDAGTASSMQSTPATNRDYSGPGIRTNSFVGPMKISIGGPEPTAPDSRLIPEVPLNTDSLTAQFLKSRIAAEKQRRLEQQVEMLQGALHACESKD